MELEHINGRRRSARIVHQRSIVPRILLAGFTRRCDGSAICRRIDHGCRRSDRRRLQYRPRTHRDCHACHVEHCVNGKYHLRQLGHGSPHFHEKFIRAVKSPFLWHSTRGRCAGHCQYLSAQDSFSIDENPDTLPLIADALQKSGRGLTPNRTKQVFPTNYFKYYQARVPR